MVVKGGLGFSFWGGSSGNAFTRSPGRTAPSVHCCTANQWPAGVSNDAALDSATGPSGPILSCDEGVAEAGLDRPKDEKGKASCLRSPPVAIVGICKRIILHTKGDVQSAAVFRRPFDLG